MVTTKMSMLSRFECLKKIKPCYLKSSLTEKTKILDEFCQTSGYNRKYAIKKLSAKVSLSEPKVINNRKRNCTYSVNDIYWLSKIWEVLDYPCGQRLAPMISAMIKILTRCGELKVSESSQEKLRQISSSTIDERLKPYRKKLRRKINGTTKLSSLIKKQIPIRTKSWDEKRIGFCELDTVAHCGSDADGEFINSINLTDLLTGWTEGAAIIGRAQKRIMTGLDDIKSRLPFPLKGIDPDNGSEFINWQLYRHELRLYKNFFLPNIKLINKKRVGQHGEKIRRIYDQTKTPYQRMMECKQVDKNKKLKLKEQYEKLNPAELRRQILFKLNRLSKMK